MLFIVVGPPGAGKSVLCKELDRVGLLKVVSLTTRTPIRQGEVEGYDYYFTNKDKIMSMLNAGELYEHSEYKGNHYAISNHEVARTIESGMPCYAILDRHGAKFYKDRYPDSKIIFITVSDPSELYRRMRNRDTNTPEEIILKRMEGIREEAEPMSNADKVIYTFKDENIGKTSIRQYVQSVLGGLT